MVLYFDDPKDWNRPNFQPNFEQLPGDLTLVESFVPETRYDFAQSREFSEEPSEGLGGITKSLEPLPKPIPITEDYEIEGYCFDTSVNPMTDDPWRKK